MAGERIYRTGAMDTGAMKSLRRSASPSFAVLLSALPCLGLAHRSAAMFDTQRRMSVSGAVRQFQWTNPHCWIELDVQRLMASRNGASRWGRRPTSSGADGSRGRCGLAIGFAWSCTPYARPCCAVPYTQGRSCRRREQRVSQSGLRRSISGRDCMRMLRALLVLVLLGWVAAGWGIDGAAASAGFTADPQGSAAANLPSWLGVWYTDDGIFDRVGLGPNAAEGPGPGVFGRILSAHPPYNAIWKVRYRAARASGEQPCRWPQRAARSTFLPSWRRRGHSRCSSRGGRQPSSLRTER